MTEVCRDCGADSYACEDTAASIRLGQRHDMTTPAQCADDLAHHHRNIEAAGGIQEWCRLQNQKKNFNNAAR